MTISPISLGNTFTNSSGTTVLGGLSSGLNTQSVINSIVAAQSAQITPLQDQVTVDNSQASALTTLQNLLTALQTAATPLVNPQSPDPDNLWAVNDSNITSNTTQPASNFLTATVASGTATGTYNISDITSVASATTQQSAAFSDTNTPVVVASGAASGQFNAGTITITGPNGTADVTFTAGDTLAGATDSVVADFNAVSSSTGLTAAVTESGSVYTLGFTNTSTGAPVSFNLTYASDVTADPDGVLSALTANSFTVTPDSTAVVVASDADSGQFNAGAITVNGPKGSGTVTLTAGQTLDEVATDFNNADSSTGLSAAVVETSTPGVYTLAFTNTATTAPVSFSLTDPAFGLTADASGVFSEQTTGIYTVAAPSDAVVVASDAAAGQLNAGTFTIQGPGGTGTITLTTGETLSAVAAAFTDSDTGLTATVGGTSGAYTLAFTNTATGTPITVSLTDPPTVATNNPDITADPDGALSAQTAAAYTLNLATTPVVVASGAAGNQFTAGTLDITGPGGSGVVTLHAGDTLSDVAADFNDASADTGISASVLETSPGEYTLVFTSTTTGAATAFNLHSDTTVTGGTGALSNTITSEGITVGTDAVFELNGTTIDRPTNTISDLISGVTLNLLQNTTDVPGANFTLQIAPDTTSIEEGITGFATAYNNFLSFYATQTQLNSSGTPASAAVLYSDTTLRSIYNEVTSEAASIVQGLSSGAPNTLAAVGISFTTAPASGTTPAVDNTLSIDSSTLLSALQTNFSGVENVFGSNLTATTSGGAPLSDVALYQSPTVAGVTSFTLNVNESGTSTVTYDDPTTGSPVTVDLTQTALGTGGVALSVPAGSGALSGLQLIYGSADNATGIVVNLSQGVADQINNALTGALQANTGLIATDQTAIQTKTTTLNTQITNVTNQVATTRQQLLSQFAALETAINAANSSLDLLNAEQLAGSVASGA